MLLIQDPDDSVRKIVRGSAMIMYYRLTQYIALQGLQLQGNAWRAPLKVYSALALTGDYTHKHIFANKSDVYQIVSAVGFQG